MENYYDSHCHVFIQKETLNLRLIFEIIFALPDILRKEENIQVNDINDIRQKKNQLKRIINFIKVGFSDSEQSVFDKMQEVYNYQFCIAPLMFDLECCFVSTRSGVNKNVAIDMKSILYQFDNSTIAFIANHEKNIQGSKKLFDSMNRNNIPAQSVNDLQEYEQLQLEAKDLFAKLREEHLDLVGFPTVLMKNYELQLDDITQLKKDNPDTVFPFIAIDPRRDGIIDRFINDIYPKHIFTGVKLYCPNGYSPTDDDLMKEGGLYDFCEKNNIPVTAHHSHGGFATPLDNVEIFGDIYLNRKVTPVHGPVQFTKAFSDEWVADRADKLNHPDLWIKVLTKYPKLKLNLAHFGNGSKEWQIKLKKMLNTYENFHSDLSCWTNKDDLMKFRKRVFLKGDDVFKSKILYGSDFYLNLLFIDSFQEFVDNFCFKVDSVFTSEEFTQIACTNAKKFLFE